MCSASLIVALSGSVMGMFAGTVEPNNKAGANAIFKLFQARPALLEKQKNPTTNGCLEAIVVVTAAAAITLDAALM